MAIVVCDKLNSSSVLNALPPTEGDEQEILILHSSSTGAKMICHAASSKNIRRAGTNHAEVYASRFSPPFMQIGTVHELIMISMR